MKLESEYTRLYCNFKRGDPVFTSKSPTAAFDKWNLVSGVEMFVLRTVVGIGSGYFLMKFFYVIYSIAGELYGK